MMRAKRSIVQRWTILGDKGVGVGDVQVRLMQGSTEKYVIHTRDDDGSEVYGVDSHDESGAREECRWALDVCEEEQTERLSSARADAARDLLESLIDSGQAQSALEALRTVVKAERGGQ
jgi:hypothetical protein